MDCHDRRVALFVLLGGIAGGLVGFGLQSWVSAIAYPVDVAGKPYISWPMFIPVTFELTILFASITAVLTWIGLSGLPLPYHPAFNVARFASHASQNGFFLAIESTDPKFDRGRTFEFLQGLGATEINEVEA
jgi:ActD protein